MLATKIAYAHVPDRGDNVLLELVAVERTRSRADPLPIFQPVGQVLGHCLLAKLQSRVAALLDLVAQFAQMPLRVTVLPLYGGCLGAALAVLVGPLNAHKPAILAALDDLPAR